MRTFQLQGDAELPERVEPFSREQVDEHLAADRVVPLRHQDVLLLRRQNTLFDQVGKNLAVGGVHFTTQNCFVTIQKTGYAFTWPCHDDEGWKTTLFIKTSLQTSLKTSLLAIF